MIQVLIADDHAMVREELCQIVREQTSDIGIDEAENGQEVLEKLQQAPYDVLVMDISMPGRNGLEILREVHLAYPALPVLILSMHPEEIYAMRILKSGASGYLTKGYAPDKLVTAIQTIAGGGTYVSDKLAERLRSDQTGHSNSKKHPPLHERSSI